MPETRMTIEDHVREALGVVSKARLHIVFAIGIFLVSMGAGAVMHDRLGSLLVYLADFAQGLKEMSTAGIILGILQKNVIATLVMIVGGIAFGVIPILSLVFNGALMGVAMMAGYQKGLGVLGFLAAIAPHGMFELPAVFIASGVAMRIGFMQFRRKGREPAKARIAEGLRVFVFIVLPLLIVAAVIEGLSIARLR